jgi:hypothetical protein
MEEEQVKAEQDLDKGADGWRDTYLVGTDLYEEPTLKTVKDIPGLAKLAVETRKTLGRYGTEKGILPPKEGAPPEELETYYQALGRPEKPEAYEIGKPENLPEGFPYAPELETQYRQWAFESGLSAAQAKNLFNKYMEANLTMYATQQQEFTRIDGEIKAALQKSWGDRYEENTAIAQQTAAKFMPAGSPELVALDKVMGDSPALIQLFYNIGKSMGEADLVQGRAAVAATLAAKKAELEGNPALMEHDHPDHTRIVDEYNAVVAKIVEQEEAKEKIKG